MSKSSLSILFLTAEMAPLAKVGGLADVAAALPKELKKIGVDIRICLPLYGFINTKKIKAKKIAENIPIFFDKKNKKINLWKCYVDDAPVYLIEHKTFKTQNIYLKDRIIKGKKNQPNIIRFSFFTLASIEVARFLNFKPQIIHSQDWHTAFAANYLKTFLARGDHFFIKTKTLLTIHNLANQGITDPKIIQTSSLDPNLPILKKDAENGDINFLVQGILNSDKINTVSQSYTKEILKATQGVGLENILKKRKKDLSGILNGIDVENYSPKIDKALKYKYNLKNIDDKVKNKILLQKKLNLVQDKNIALVGFIGRLYWQKGIDLITEEFKSLNCQFIFLGEGDKNEKEKLKKIAKKYPNKFKVLIEFNEDLSRLIYAACDIILIPSRFEPCGLVQMIAMCYGTVPVARATGGLFDTIVNYKDGFLFKKISSKALFKTLRQALNIFYTQPKTWRKIQINGFKKDFSWKKPALKYLALYRDLK